MLRHMLCFLSQAHWSNMLRQHVVLFFASSLEQSVTIHGCAFLCELTGAKCYDTRLCLSLRQTTGTTCYDTRCAFLFAAHWNNMLRHMLCFLFESHWSNMLRHMLCFHCSSKRAWSVTDIHTYPVQVRCAFQVTLRLCRTFPGFLGHPRN